MCFWDNASPAFETLPTPNPEVQASQGQAHMSRPKIHSQNGLDMWFRNVPDPPHDGSETKKIIPIIELFEHAL